MFDIKWIRENDKAFDEGLRRRGLDPQSEELLAIDDRRKENIARLQDAQTRRNAASKEIGKAMGAGDKALAETLKSEVAGLKQTIHDGEQKERELSAELTAALEVLPNLPLLDVPVGEDELANVEHHLSGRKPAFSFEPKEHFDIGEALGQMDFERAAKLAGSRFTVLSGGLARLERALGQFMLDLHVNEHGYTEVQPPLLVHDRTMYGTGQLPKFETDLFVVKSEEILGRDFFDFSIPHPGELSVEFKGPNAEQLERNFTGKVFLESRNADISSQIKPIVEQNRWLIPTAEVPLTNLVAGEILDHAELPLRYTALTPCFRSEAGSAGRDTRGMLRQHQFNKVELVSVTTPEKSLEEHERMLACAEEVLKRLGLHYRVMVLSTGDMGFGAQKTYDIEVWLPGQKAYREISSCSVCGDFQARRMNARYRPAGEKHPVHVHTLNGSGVAVGRALIAVLENFQDQDGSVTVPEILAPYMGGIKKLAPEA